MTFPLLLLRVLIFVPPIVLGGCIGAWVAGRFGRDRRVGFALGSVGAVGGWMLAAIRPGGGDRENGLVRALNWVYAAAGVLLACTQGVMLVLMGLTMVNPYRFGWIITALGSETPPLAWSLLSVATGVALILLWVLSWVVLLRDYEPLPLSRERWILGLSAYVGALLYAPVRQRAVAVVCSGVAGDTGSRIRVA